MTKAEALARIKSLEKDNALLRECVSAEGKAVIKAAMRWYRAMDRYPIGWSCDEPLGRACARFAKKGKRHG